MQVAHGVAGEGEFGGAACREIVDAVLVVGERQQLDDALDWLVGAGRQIEAPEHVDQLRARLERYFFFWSLLIFSASSILSSMPGLAGR